jgi:hypothetical protein
LTTKQNLITVKTLEQRLKLIPSTPTKQILKEDRLTKKFHGEIGFCLCGNPVFQTPISKRVFCPKCRRFVKAWRQFNYG